MAGKLRLDPAAIVPRHLPILSPNEEQKVKVSPEENIVKKLVEEWDLSFLNDKEDQLDKSK